MRPPGGFGCDSAAAKFAFQGSLRPKKIRFPPIADWIPYSKIYIFTGSIMGNLSPRDLAQKRRLHFKRRYC